MIKYEIEGNTTKAWFINKHEVEVSWFFALAKDLKKMFGINILNHELCHKFYNYVMNMPWYAIVTCKGGDKFCPVMGKEMAKKKLLKRYYICLFKCRDMVIAYYEQKTDEAIKKAQLGKLACKIYDLEDELREKK